MPAQRGCKAAEKQAGQQGHWDYFDRAQQAHLSDCENVADPEVLTRCARDVGLDVNAWLRDFEDAQRDIEIGMDLGLAKAYGVVRVPILIADGRAQLHGEPWSTFGYRITAERLDAWYADLARARQTGRF
jgi:predicted DsbA family dithiol-disulfide isomerase